MGRVKEVIFEIVENSNTYEEAVVKLEATKLGKDCKTFRTMWNDARKINKTTCLSVAVVSENCTCDTDYGLFGHREFAAEFHCPTCEEMITIRACQAWPIVVKACPNCGIEHEWSLSEQMTHCPLR
jgi:predicted RNA-binding Zn-ribbon protein involved in translation (DUF1610 family)